MSERITIDRSSEDFDRRLAAARRRSEWELGDGSWAGMFIAAFLDPEADAESLAREQAVYDTSTPLKTLYDNEALGES